MCVLCLRYRLLTIHFLSLSFCFRHWCFWHRLFLCVCVCARVGSSVLECFHLAWALASILHRALCVSRRGQHVEAFLCLQKRLIVYVCVCVCRDTCGVVGCLLFSGDCRPLTPAFLSSFFFLLGGLRAPQTPPLNKQGQKRVQSIAFLFLWALLGF